MSVHSYTAETYLDERDDLRIRFAAGKLQGLVAIRCLDEGVDIPETRRAFILASSTNPKQFIQRRGRVLRRAPGKELAEIHDFLVVPPARIGTDEFYATERRLFRRELERILLFRATGGQWSPGCPDAPSAAGAVSVVRPWLGEDDGRYQEEDRAAD